MLCQFGDRLKAEFGDVRYVETIWHNGQQWTKKSGWERLEAGKWIEITWTEMPNP